MNKFPCVPGSWFIPAYFSFGELFVAFVFYLSIDRGLLWESVFFFAVFVCIAAFIIGSWDKAMQKVQIYSGHIVCRTPFCPTIVMEYEKCTVGMDYHWQRGCKVWWIYLCYGPSPKFDSKKPYNRMNSLKCKPGFIRIMYSDEVCQALIAVLPKKKQTALITACRCAGVR